MCLYLQNEQLKKENERLKQENEDLKWHIRNLRTIAKTLNYETKKAVEEVLTKDVRTSKRDV